jgi:NTE family protein
VRIQRSIIPVILGLGFLAIVPARGSVPADTSLLVIRPQLTERSPRIPGFITRHLVRRPRIGVVLSGGGARGMAAIGVLRALEQNDIPIDLIVGTSIGSIVGGLYASGYSTDELQRLVDTTDWEDILSLNDEARRRDMFLDQKLARDKSVLVLRFKGLEPIIPQALSTGRRLTDYLNLLTLQGIYHPDPSFDDLRVPFRAVATDLVSGKRVVMDRGDLAEALRASTSIPLLFSTVPRDSAELLDGGLVANLPVDVAQQAGADIVISVDMMSPLRPRERLKAPWEIVDQISTIMMQEANRIARSRSDVVVTPDLGDHLSSDFTSLDTLILRGQEATEQVLPMIREIFRLRTLQQYTAAGSRIFRHPRWRMIPDEDPAQLAGLTAAFRGRTEIAEAELRAFAADLAENGAFDDVSLTVRTAADSSEITITGRLFPVLRAVEVKGTNNISADTVLNILRSLTGRRLNAREAERTLERVLGVYRDHGYSLARVREVRFDSTSGLATLTIDEGIINLSVITESAKTRDWVIRRELPWSIGDVFNVSRASQAIANLNGTSLFEQAMISVRHEGAQHEQNVVTTTVRERNTELIRLGLRADNERNIQPSIDVRDENFLGAGAEIGLMTGFGPRNQFVLAEAKDTRIFDTYLTVGLKGYLSVRDVNVYGYSDSSYTSRFDRERIGEYRERRYGGSFSFGTQLERLGTVTIEGRLEQHKVTSVYQSPVTEQDYRITSIRLGTNIDTQDKFPYPKDGVAITFFYESALMKVTNSVGFTKLFFSYERSHTFAERHTIRPKFVLGVGDETLPLTEQFSLGGQSSFFGLPEDDSRGRQMLIGSLEYQYEIPLQFVLDAYFKARYDIGSVWLKPDEIRLEDLRHGIGVSLGFDTPVGPAEVALGRSFFLRKDLLGRPVTWGPVTFSFSIGYPIAVPHERR